MSDLVGQADGTLVEHLAQVKVRAMTSQQVGAIHQMTEAELITLYQSDKDLAPRVDARAALLELSGEAVESKATAGLHVVVDRLRELIDDPDASDSSVVRAGELLSKLAGQQDKVGVRTRAREGVTGERFVLNINLAGDTKPITVEGSIIDQEVDKYDEDE